MILDISFGKNRTDTNWKPEFLNWGEFVDGRLRKVRRTSETMAQYDKMNNIARGKLKDGPAFVGGLVRGGRRKKENVDTRSLITLDVDHVADDFLFAAELVLGGTAYLIYSTHSHRSDKPKYRLVVLVDRTMNPDEYAAASRKLSEQIGMDYFDKTTFDVHRLMYLPSCSKDAEPVLEVYEGDPLSVDGMLAEYDDWRDPLQWPRHPDDKVQRITSRRMEDPKAKLGVVGAFCRCYSISEAIDAFLPSAYDPVDDSLQRYTHVGSSSFGGLVVYDEDTFAYSHHESDPCSGREVNSFDLVRLHKFGRLDDRASEKTNIDKLPSHTAMLAFASQDGKVKRERLSELSDDFEGTEAEKEQQPDVDWIDQLKTNSRTGFPVPTSKNIRLILTNGTFEDVLAYDDFSNAEVIKKELPWRGKKRPDTDYEPWLGADDRQLQHWFGESYELKSASTIQNAFTHVCHSNSFHPIRDYLESSPWDGIRRIDTLFIDYLGAEDNHYVRQATRKMLIAAIARLYHPGCKFDEMLVLVGPQGSGKSSLLSKLGRKWFSDSLRTFDNKEAGEHLQVGWIFEIGELSAMKKSEVEEVKSFLSKTEDRYRVAYDRVVSDFPRKCVFFGTTNTRDFLQDTTGNRRFWPVDIDPKNSKYSHWDYLTDGLVEQIWAEALHLYKAGESLSLDKEAIDEAVKQQTTHFEVDPREGVIREWLDSPIEDEWRESTSKKQYHNRVCAIQVWVDCLHKKKGDMNRWDARVICGILRNIPELRELRGRIVIPVWGKQTAFERRR